MQGPTHIAVGVTLEKLFKPIKNKALRVVLLAIVALLLHSVFDRIARLTYHPPNANMDDKFWLYWHLFVYSLFLISVIYFLPKYPVGVGFSILPDLDWVFIHGASAMGIQDPWYDKPYIHTGIHYIIDHLPPFMWLQYLPNLTAEKWTIVNEIGLVIVLVLFVRWLNKRAI